MMQRLQQIEDGISNTRKNMESNLRQNQEAQIKVDKMINQMENIIARENIPEFRGDREALTK